MDRSAIKKKSKNIVKDKMFDIWKVLIINIGISLLYTVLFTYVFKDQESLLYIILSTIYNLITIPISFGVTKYLLALIRNKKYVFKDIFYYYTHNILDTIILSIVMTILLTLGSVLFLLPALIMYFMFAMAENIFVDGQTKPMVALKESISLMKGYKWDYFNFLISFLGWCFLGFVTMGIAFIWVTPYMMLSEKIYYEELLKIKK